MHAAPNECREPSQNEREPDFVGDLSYLGNEKPGELQNESQSYADVCI